MQGLFEGAVVEHMIAGRVRIRFRSRRGDSAFFEEVVKTLSLFPQVDGIEANPRTGSVLIKHRATRDEIAALGLAAAAPAASPRRRTGETSANDTAMTLGLSGLALVQALRGRMFGSASEQFWHARQLHKVKPGIATALIGVGIGQLLFGSYLAPASSLVVYALLSRAEALAEAARAGSTAHAPAAKVQELAEDLPR